jgi:FkbM family methyltransferase
MAQAFKKLLTTLEKELIKNRLIVNMNFNLRLIPKIIMFLFLLPIYVLVRLPFLYSRIVMGAIDCIRLMVWRIRYFRSWGEYKKIVDQINQKVKWSHGWKTIMWDYLNTQKTIVEFRSQMKEKKQLILFSPNQFSSYRAETIFTKEEDTIQWIKSCGSHDALFIDIGANIGIYTLFYLSYFSGKAIAVEPGFEHLSLLSRNLSVNNLSDRCTIIPLPINSRAERTRIRFHLSDGPGPASKTEEYDKSRESSFFTSTINLSMLLVNGKFISEDNLQNLVIKIDVDGPEMEVLSGIWDLLESCRKVSLMIEIGEEETCKKVIKILDDKGFTRKDHDYIPSGQNTFWEKCT